MPANMKKLTMCRICLTEEDRMHFLEKHLQDTFERLTAIPFETEDRRPVLACYICHARLQNSYKLRMSSLQGEELLIQMVNSNLLKPQKNPRMNKLEVASVLHLSMGRVQESKGCDLNLEAAEMFDDVDVKEECSEVSDEEDNILPLAAVKIEPIDITTNVENVTSKELYIEIDGNTPYSDSDNNIPTETMTELDDDNKSVPVYTSPYIALKKEYADTSASIPYTDEQENSESANKMIVMDQPVPIYDIYGTRDNGDVELYNLKENETMLTAHDVKIEKENAKSKNCTVETVKPFSCDTCQKRFISRAHLESHILVHTGEKPHQCEVCKKCFNLKSNLKRHFRTHTGEKPFKCNVCKKYFNRKSNLECHIRTHTEDKPCECEVCQKYSNQNSLLVYHTRTHAREKPFQCNVCNKSFSKKGDLGRHARIHTGEKPYQCEVCNERFNRTSNLASHMRKHTGEKPYQCELCKRCFNLKSNLNRHIRLHTGTLFAMTISKPSQRQSLV